MTDTLTGSTGENAAQVPEYPLPRAARCPFDPPRALRELHGAGPVAKIRLWDGSEPLLVAGYADQRALLSDPRVSADTLNDNYPHQSESMKVRARVGRSFISMDDPEHARLRRMVTGPFAVKRVEAMRPAVQRIVDDLIDRLLAGPRPVDLVAEFALPLPSMVICELLGVPYADHDFFQDRSRRLISLATPVDESIAAQREITDYLVDLVGRKLAEPGDDLLSKLATEQLATGGLTRRELAELGLLLLIAGHETTANMIALGTLALLEHPDQLALLRERGDDPGLVAGAAEELLRYLSVVNSGRRRVALEDIELNGVTIRAGEGLVLANDAANRDESVFFEPDRLDLTRDARHHVAFGFGPHQCLGQPLARVELQVVYGTLYRRIPTLKLAAGLEEIPFKGDGIVYGVYELPVTW